MSFSFNSNSVAGFSLAGAAPVSALPIYNRVIRESPEVARANFAKRPQVKADIEYFRAKIGTVKSAEELVRNPRLISFALTVYGMESQANLQFRVKQVLMSDPDDRYSAAERMSDQRYRRMMQDFDMFRQGVGRLKETEFVDYLVDGYVTAEHEKDLGQRNPTLTDALYFRRKIKDVAKTSQLFGDFTMFDVVKETLNLPNAVVNLPPDQLAERVERGFDVKRIDEPGYVDRFVQRYLVVKQAKAQLQGKTNFLSGMFA